MYKAFINASQIKFKMPLTMADPALNNSVTQKFGNYTVFYAKSAIMGGGGGEGIFRHRCDGWGGLPPSPLKKIPWGRGGLETKPTTSK